MKSYIYIEGGIEDVDPITWQIVTKIKKMSPQVRGSLTGLCIGKHSEDKDSKVNSVMEELIRVKVPTEHESNTEVIAKILTDIVRENGPGILFLGFSHQGMEVAPSVAWRLRVPLITNCVDFEWGPDEACVKRPIQRSKQLAVLTFPLECGAVISVQKGALKSDEIASGSGDSVLVRNISWRSSWAPEKSKVVSVTEETPEDGEDITKAEILVSVGRGLGEPENLPIIKEFADRVGGAISCSRPVVDLGWLPASRQVGISGKTVAPLIYLALGISGQSNHVAGMDSSKLIIAINKDPSAPIFNVADYGVVDDILEFVPKLLERMKQQ